MLIIFDVDGTLIGGETCDWASFDAAIKHCTGFAATPEFWQAQKEVTAQSIVHAALGLQSPEEKKRIEILVQAMHLEELTNAHRNDPETFRPTVGACELLKHLAAMDGIQVALATGDWHPTITFKLDAAGIDISAFPMATSSDCLCRSDIISLAASRAGRSLEDCIYVGDGIWDLRACRQLGIPFIGTGAKINRLLEAGATHVLSDLLPPAFLATLEKITSQTSR